MGIVWSTSHHYYIHHVENPRSQRVKKEIVLNLGNEAEFPFTSLVAPEPSTQNAVIVSINTHMIRNELDTDVTVRLCNVWPDKRDPINILCPKNFTRIFKEEAESCVYNNPLEPAVVELYAGLEAVLLCSSAVSVNEDADTQPPQQECYRENHPLVQFMLQNERALKAVDGDIVRKSTEDDCYFLVQTAFAERVRELFRNTVLHDLRSTRFENCTLEYELPEDANPNAVMLVLEIDYVLINSGSGTLHHISQEIK